MTMVIGNSDKDSVEVIMKLIIDRVVQQKQASNMSLYQQYQQNNDFQVNFRSLITRLIGIV